MKRIFNLIFCVIAFLGLTSCTRCSSVISNLKVISSSQEIYCVTYNAQTFFDAIEDGREFAEFKGSKTKWTPEMYKARLERLREVAELSVETLGGGKNRMPDIFVVQEIESERVIEDFAKLFSTDEGYEAVVFFPPTGSGNFSTAIFSRFPVVKYEQFKLESSSFSTSGLRPLVKATVEIPMAEKNEYLTIFGIHWKSKKGDGTEVVRKAQQDQLVRQVSKTLKQDPEAHILICGDFNQQGFEFYPMEDLQDAWQLETATKTSLGVEGSYLYEDTWEDIDHMFFSHNLNDGVGLDIVDFAPIAVSPLIRNNGKPNEFRLSNGAGYSDHLPLCAVLSFF